MSLNIADTSGTQLIVRVGNKGSSRVSGWTTLDPNGGSSSGLFIWDGLEVSGPITCSSLFSTNITTTNLQLNGSSLNTIITGITNITSPSNLIATNLTTINGVFTNLSSSNASIGSLSSGSLFSTNGVFTDLSSSTLRTTNLTTTNLQLNGSSLNTIITNITAPSNLIATNLTGQNLKITNIYQEGWLEYKAEGFPGYKIYSTSGTNGELIFNRDGGKILTIDEYLYINTGLTTPNINSTNLTTTNLQLNGSSLNTIISGITAPSNLIATNSITTSNAVINSFSRHLKIDGGLTGLPAETNFQLYITGNEGSPNVGSLYVGDGTGWGFNFKRRTGSTDTVIGRIHDNGDLWMSNGISTSNLRTTNLTTTNGVFTNVCSNNLKLSGSITNINGPHIFNYGNNDNSNPISQWLNWERGNSAINFNSYYDGSNWKRSSNLAAYQIYNQNESLDFNYVISGPPAGSNITWNKAMSIVQSTISCGNFECLEIITTNLTNRFNLSNVIELPSFSIGNLDIEDFDIISTAPGGPSLTLTLPNIFSSNFLQGFSKTFILRNLGGTSFTLGVTGGSGSIIGIPTIATGALRHIVVRKEGNTAANYYVMT